MSLFPGLCRVHRAGLLQWRGEWIAAEAEARQACAELEGINVPNAAAGFVKIGEIRRRIGDYDGAEEAFRRAEELTGQAWVGLALVRLAQGRHQVAATIIDRATVEDPSLTSTGIDAVLVAGTPVLRGGQMQRDQLPGTALRSG